MPCHLWQSRGPSHPSCQKLYLLCTTAFRKNCIKPYTHSLRCIEQLFAPVLPTLGSDPHLAKAQPQLCSSLNHPNGPVLWVTAGLPCTSIRGEEALAWCVDTEVQDGTPTTTCVISAEYRDVWVAARLPCTSIRREGALAWCMAHRSASRLPDDVRFDDCV